MGIVNTKTMETKDTTTNIVTKADIKRVNNKLKEVARHDDFLAHKNEI